MEKSCGFHAGRETGKAVFSFGQGCEGEPLTAKRRCSIEFGAAFTREAEGMARINQNSNSSRPAGHCRSLRKRA